jgi:hypothetical protein
MNLDAAVGNRPIAYGFSRASEVSSLSKNTLRRKAKTGELRTVLVGRRRVIPFEALYALINGSPAKT